MHERRHDPARIFSEVYDHPQPQPRPCEIRTIEALTASNRIILTKIRRPDRPEDVIDTIKQRTAQAPHKVQGSETALEYVISPYDGSRGGVSELRSFGQWTSWSESGCPDWV